MTNNITMTGQYKYASDEVPAFRRVLCVDGNRKNAPVVTENILGYTRYHNANGVSSINSKYNLIPCTEWDGIEIGEAVVVGDGDGFPKYLRLFAGVNENGKPLVMNKIGEPVSWNYCRRATPEDLKRE